MAVLEDRLRLLDSLGSLHFTPARLAALAQEHGEEVARWLASQAKCHKKAVEKFARAKEMLFDPDGLAMSTHEEVARWRASRFPAGERVVDLCCGIGADLIALARRGPALGIERDPVRAEYARHNLRVHGLEAEIVVGDCLEWLDGWGGTVAYAFLDPARRAGGRRMSLELEAYSPNPLEVLQRLPSLVLGAVKLSPMLRDEQLLSMGPQVEFVSYGWECREALVWVGPKVEAGIWAVKVDAPPDSPQ